MSRPNRSYNVHCRTRKSYSEPLVKHMIASSGSGTILSLLLPIRRPLTIPFTGIYVGAFLFRSEYVSYLITNYKRRKPEITYVRLNPSRGLADIDLAEFTRGADIEAITNQYLERPEVADQVVNFAASIKVVSRTVWKTIMYLTD
jgi:hypothetical protein